MTLTVKAIEAAKPKDKPYKLTDEKGLYLFVSTAGGKSFRANFSVNGKQQTRTYGRFPALSLADARKAHAEARSGPVEASAPTFEHVARLWLKKHLPSLSNPKHQSQVQGTLESYVFPKIGSRPVDQIERKELTAIVLGVGDKIETAHRVAGRISAVFDYAQDLGEIDKHPASHLTRVLTPRRIQRPMASIPKEEAGVLLRAIGQYPDLLTRLALQLMAHTFVRVNELRGMQWDELRENDHVWVVPAERMKGDADKKKPHVVPLSKQARGIVARVREINDGCAFAFDSPANPGHPISENTMLFALYRMGYKHRMTVHGFRALASTVLNEESGFARDVIERQLAHKESDEVRAAYNRAQYLEQRRQLMQWWANWLQGAAADPQPASE